VLTGRVASVAAVVAVALGVGLAVVATGTDALPLAGAAAGVALLLGLVYRVWLGGATGDCLGAATELVETTVLVVAAGLA
jgi:cobalamin synthase